MFRCKLFSGLSRSSSYKPTASLLGVVLAIASILFPRPSIADDAEPLAFRIIVNAAHSLDVEKEFLTAARTVAQKADWDAFSPYLFVVQYADGRPSRMEQLFCGEKICYQKNPPRLQWRRLELVTGTALLTGQLRRAEPDDPTAISATTPVGSQDIRTSVLPRSPE